MAGEFCLKSVDSDQPRSSFLLSPTPAREGKARSHLCCQAPCCAQSHCLEQGQPCEMSLSQAKRFVSPELAKDDHHVHALCLQNFMIILQD